MDKYIIFNKKIRCVKAICRNNIYYYEIESLNSNRVSKSNKVHVPGEKNYFLNKTGIEEITKNIKFTDDVPHNLIELYKIINVNYILLNDAIQKIDKDFRNKFKSLQLHEKKYLLDSPAWAVIIYMETRDKTISELVLKTIENHTMSQPRYKPITPEKYPIIKKNNYCIFLNRIHKINCSTIKEPLDDCECHYIH